MQILEDGKVRKMGFFGKNRRMTSDLMEEEKRHSMPHNGRNGGITSSGMEERESPMVSGIKEERKAFYRGIYNHDSGLYTSIMPVS